MARSGCRTFTFLPAAGALCVLSTDPRGYRDIRSDPFVIPVGTETVIWELASNHVSTS